MKYSQSSNSKERFWLWRLQVLFRFPCLLISNSSAARFLLHLLQKIPSSAVAWESIIKREEQSDGVSRGCVSEGCGWSNAATKWCKQKNAPLTNNSLLSRDAWILGSTLRTLQTTREGNLPEKLFPLPESLTVRLDLLYLTENVDALGMDPLSVNKPIRSI